MSAARALALAETGTRRVDDFAGVGRGVGARTGAAEAGH